jgi:hypothetical protein
MPLDLRAKFSKTAEVTFDVDAQTSSRSKVVLDKSLEHSSMCDNTETLQQAKSLSRELDEDIECRIKRYSK